jgi:hypothetical protein
MPETREEAETKRARVLARREAFSRERLDEKSLAEAGMDLEAIKRRGHVAIFLHRYMRQHGMSVSDFNEHVLLIRRDATTPYPWLKLVSGPTVRFARQMQSVMAGVPVSFFQARDLDDDQPVVIPDVPPAPETWTAPRYQGARTVFVTQTRAKKLARERKLLQAATVPAPVLPVARALLPSDPMSEAAPPPSGLRYVSHGDGTVSVSVSVRLPASHARPLFRMLMDAGLDGDPAKETNHEGPLGDIRLPGRQNHDGPP